MARKVFYSFHYQNDGWHASKVRNIGIVEGNVQRAITSGKKSNVAVMQRFVDG